MDGYVEEVGVATKLKNSRELQLINWQ